MNSVEAGGEQPDSSASGGEVAHEVSQTASTRGGLVNGLASVIGTGLAFAMTLVITNEWGAASTGVFMGALAAFVIVATALKLGVETALVLFISREVATGQAGGGRAILRMALPPVAAAAGLAAIGLHFGAEPIAGWFTDSDTADEFVEVIGVLAWFVPAWTLSLCLLGATRGAGTMAPTAYGLQFAQPAAQFALVSAAAFADADITTLALAWAAPVAATMLVGLVMSLRLLPPKARASASAGHAGHAGAEPVVDRREFWAYAGPRGVAGTLQMALDRIGVLIVGAVAGAVVAGQWAVVSRIVGVAQRVFHAIGQALNPRLSALAGRGAWDEVGLAVDRITRWTLLAVGPGLVGVACFPRTVLRLFGDEFVDAALALQIAAIIVLAATVLAHADNVLLMAGESRQVMLITAAALIASVIALFVLVPPLEAAGAALAFGVGVAVYRGGAAARARRDLGVQVVGSLGRGGLASAILASFPIAVTVRATAGDTLVGAIVAAIGVAGAVLLAIAAHGS